ncbi:MAG: hypothetical protein ABI741_00540 [Ferruginibacter sp.]
MKSIVFMCFAALILSACASSKNYLERTDEDKALSDAVKKLGKSPTDENALQAVPVLYTNILKKHLVKIKDLKAGKELNRWDKIINEYQDLQDAYDAIINNPPAFKLVSPQSYSTELFDAKQSGAEAYYNEGQVLLDNTGRDNAKKAYGYFKKAEKIIPGYKDAIAKSDQAYESAIVNVIINPVQDNSYYFNSSWGNSGYNFSNEYFQQALVRDLSGINKNRYPARFYTDWQARRDNVQPDWIVDLKLRNIDIPYPSNNNYSRNASAQVQTGTDTSGNPVYRTVYATVNITRSSFTARADMDVNITDVITGKNISFRNIRDDYRWQEERATYNGDSRALSARDWEMINNGAGYGTPRKEEVLDELFKKIYPQVKNNIIYAVDW